MTKKFWKDWQNRIGETKTVFGWVEWTDFDDVKRKYIGGNLLTYLPFKILSAKFTGDTVNLKLEITSEDTSNHYHVENKYFTLHRNEISTVKFKK